jgi:glycosyltransferase involved in cell wall biosynthesis
MIGANANAGVCARREETLLTPVTVVVPCFNEEALIPALAQACTSLARSLEGRYLLDFLFVDDGSTDSTYDELCRAVGGTANCAIVRHARNRGIAAAIMTGIRQARSEIVCSIDADCTYDPAQLAEMIPLLGDGVDMVTASPYHPSGRVRDVPAWRLALSKTASRLYRCVMRQKLFTYTSCFRVYRRRAVLGFDLDRDDFVGVTELLWRLDCRGGRIVEYPALLESRIRTRSKMNLLKTAAGHGALLARAFWARIASQRQSLASADRLAYNGPPSDQEESSRPADPDPCV